MDMDQSSDSSDDEKIYELNNIDVYSTVFDMTSLSNLIENKSGLSSVSQNSDIVDVDERITLAYEKLNYIPRSLIDRLGDTLKILDLSHNNISNLEFLVHFKNLNSFIADDNPIDENTLLPPMPNLKLLWLNHCKISKLHPWIKKLNNSCPGLNHLSLMGNEAAPSYLNGGTFYEYLQYRLYVLSLFDSLIHLDDRSVTNDQKSEAKRLYKRPLLERISIFTDKDFPFSVTLCGDTTFNFSMLHQKMAVVLNKTSNCNSTPETSRNRLI